MKSKLQTKYVQLFIKTNSWLFFLIPLWLSGPFLPSVFIHFHSVNWQMTMNNPNWFWFFFDVHSISCRLVTVYTEQPCIRHFVLILMKWRQIDQNVLNVSLLIKRRNKKSFFFPLIIGEVFSSLFWHRGNIGQSLITRQ